MRMGNFCPTKIGDKKAASYGIFSRQKAGDWRQNRTKIEEKRKKGKVCLTLFLATLGFAPFIMPRVKISPRRRIPLETFSVALPDPRRQHPQPEQPSMKTLKWTRDAETQTDPDDLKFELHQEFEAFKQELLRLTQNLFAAESPLSPTEHGSVWLGSVQERHSSS